MSPYHDFQTRATRASALIVTCRRYLTPAQFAAALIFLQTGAAVAQLLSDLRPARRQLLEAGRALAATISAFGAPDSEPALRAYAGRHVEQQFREKRQLGGVIDELEARASEGRRRADELRHVLLIARERGGLESFTFEERRLALEVLGVKVHANGDDPARWRYEINSRAARRGDRPDSSPAGV